MKNKIYTRVFPIIFFLGLYSISYPQDSISLKTYCPTKYGQKGSLCFAYAPVYTALSVMHNIRDNFSREDDFRFWSFSYGFVASQVKKEKKFTSRLFNKCGRSASADLALGVLIKKGTVPYDQFPEKCDCQKSERLESLALKFRIRDSVILNYNASDENQIEEIKRALKEGTPVIIAILQEDFFAQHQGSSILNFPTAYKRETKEANHVVCVLGFNDKRENGVFLVKNNYHNWGENGFAYIKYSDLIKIIRCSYLLTL